LKIHSTSQNYQIKKTKKIRDKKRNKKKKNKENRRANKAITKTSNTFEKQSETLHDSKYFNEENLVLFTEETIDGRIGFFREHIPKVNDWGQEGSKVIHTVDYCFSTNIMGRVLLRCNNNKFISFFT